jgi:hypothetical protein
MGRSSFRPCTRSSRSAQITIWCCRPATSPQEALLVIRDATGAGVKKLVCTHADYDPINMSIDDQRQAAKMGAFIEHAFIGTFLGPGSPAERFRQWRGATVEQMAAAIKTVGAESSILSSDMGANPIGIPAEGYAKVIRSSTNWV